MKNTLRWQLTSSALHSFIGGLEQAYGYAQDLNKSLTDIRIVAPEKSLGDMADFAKVANKQAKELGASTLDYVNGALIYYQQGLDDLETKARTDVTIKMRNVTGDSAEDVSSYMTAIWNNFNKDGEHAEEYYADVLTKLGADTAASTTEITSALEKYSAVADTIGLSYEAATAAATTLIDRTREAPEVAGTALKTVFARLQGLKLNGEVTDEDGVTTDLNKYSTGLASVGV
ncbi:MAG: phage tail tape measure protein [Bacilli bacterium]